MAHMHALESGHEFDGYRIERVLGSGGFGITYLATETSIGRKVAIKEFLPSTIAARAAGGVSVHPLAAGDTETFRWGLKRFRNEARTLVTFHHRNIVQVYRYFEGNGTAYLVMAYEEGASLGEILKKARALTEAEVIEILDPLLDGVAEVHKAGFLHRDIKPANIMIRADGSPVLIDFGAARQAMNAKSARAKSQSLHAIVSPGYAPFEQYSSAAEQGPYTDIYALGATLYCCVTGTKPLEAPDRVAGAAMRTARELAAGRYNAPLLAAIDRALAVHAEDRPQTIAAWREELRAPAASASDSTLMPPTEETAPPPAETQARMPPVPAPSRPTRRAVQIGLFASIAAIAAAGSYALMRSPGTPERKPEVAKTPLNGTGKPRSDESIRREREEAAARQRAEAAAVKAREAAGRALATERLANAARQFAIQAADCARKAAVRGRARENGFYAGKLDNGNYYEGQLSAAKNLVEGCGVVVEPSGGTYEGQHVAGNWQGYGVRTTKQGLRYEGGYLANQINGHGAFRFADGTELRVAAEKGVVLGSGVWVNPDGTRYDGDLVAERWTGFGVVRLTNGSLYEGEFSNGKMHGLGVFTQADGTKQHGRWDQGDYKGLV